MSGHGFINEQSDVVEYRDMMIIIRDVIQDLIKQGKTLEQIKEANPTRGSSFSKAARVRKCAATSYRNAGCTSDIIGTVDVYDATI